MEYPREFSREARNHIESANILASKELGQRRQTLTSLHPGFTSEDFNRAFLRAVLKVFLVFAEEAVKLKNTDKWSLDRVRRDSEEFLRRLTIDWRYEEGYDRARSRVPEVAGNWGGDLLDWVVRGFKEAPEWAQYESLLLGSGQPVPAVPLQVADEINLNESQRQRFLEAEKRLETSLEAHEQMREIVDPGEWKAASSGPNTSTIEGEIRKLERDIRKYATTVLSLRAEALWTLNSLEPFRSGLEADAGAILERAIGKINQEDLPFLDKGSLETAVNKEIERWIQKAQREFPPPWIAEPRSNDIQDQREQPPTPGAAEALSNTSDHPVAGDVGVDSPAATRSSEIRMFQAFIQPLKVRLRRELISPEEALNELRAIAKQERYPVTLRARILEELAPLSEASSRLEDPAVNGLRAALKQPSEKIRREAAAIIFDRIMASPEIRDYQAAKRHSERLSRLLKKIFGEAS